MKLFPSNKFFKCFNEVQSLNATGDDRRGGTAGDEPEGGTDWSTMLPDLLAEIIKRVDAAGEQWPHRRNVVACAGVCKRWRDITREIVQPPSLSAKITFPSCLKQPGPRDLPNHCLVKWNKKTSTFYLYLALTTSLTDKGKFLLAARRYRCFTHTEYVISLDADDFSQGSNAYVGKLSSDFLEANFTIYDSQTGSKPSNSRASRRFSSKQINPHVPAGNFEAGNVSYKKFNVLKTKRPRRMICSLKSPTSSLSESSYSKSFDGHNIHFKEHATSSSYTILKNKAPMWNEQLECWFLNFHERKDMTVASVKNFQLVATVDQSQPEGKGDEETVLLQFCKVGADTFTMYYRQPLSAFQAFAICLTSFGIKPASLTDKGKFLLAARRYRCFTHTEYVISLDADDFSQGSNAYVGKLSSDFLEANFTIYDSQTGSKPSNDRASRRFSSKLITPQVPAGNFEAGNVSYKKFNVLKTKRPRRMICSLKSPASSLSESSYSKSFDGHNIHFKEHPTSSYTILKNKAPMWNEQLECWFLNFHERKDMTVASVKNFQLVATVDQSQPEGKGDEETVLLQFCKVGADTFTMYYRQPLSAFQAFAICLTSFGIKPACQ